MSSGSMSGNTSLRPRHQLLQLAKRLGLRRLSVLALALVLTACSATSFIYNRLHIFIPWVVDDYINLDSRQEQQLEVLLKEFINEHRQDYLPRYVAIIDQLLVALDKPLTSEQLESIYQRVEGELALLQTESLNWMLDIGDTVSDEQMREFLDNVKEEHQKDEEKFLSRDAEEYQRDNYERLKDLYSDYLGRLSPEQLQLLRDCSQALSRIDRFWLEQQAQRTEQLAEILLNRGDHWKQAVRDLIGQQASEVSPEYQQAFQHNIGLLTDTAVTLINSRSEKQDRRVRAKLGSLSEDLLELSRQQ